MSKKQPYIPFFTGDYLKDTRCLSLAARGAWVDLLMYMWDAPERGVLEGSIASFATLCSTDRKRFRIALHELLKFKICDRSDSKTPGQFQLINRRMARNAEISNLRSAAGKKSVEAKASTKGSTKGEQNTGPSIGPGIEVNFNESHIFSEITVHKNLFGDHKWIAELTAAHPGEDLESAFKACYLHHSAKPVPPRTLWQWRQKLNTWLTIKSQHQNRNESKKYDHVIEAAKDFAKRHGGTGST